MHSISSSHEPMSEKPKFYDASKEDASAYAGRVCRESWGNSRFVSAYSSSEHFRANRGVTYHDIPFLTKAQKEFLDQNGGMYFPKGYTFTNASDGIGTKVLLADALQKYATIARDLVAMAADDVARYGWLPLVYNNVLDLRELETEEQKDAYAGLFHGLAEVAKEQDLVILTGETANLGYCIGSPNPNAVLPFNWSGTICGLQHERLTITGQNVRPGDLIIACRQDGFGSNGISKVRRAFEKRYGPNYYLEAPREELEQALAPSVVYARAIAEINGWYTEGEKIAQLTSVSHLSGGSFVSKFLEPVLLPQGLSANLYNLFAIPEITRKCAMWLLKGGDPMSLETMYTTWCNGQRMLLTVQTAAEADRVIDVMEQHGIEAQVAGEIVETPKDLSSSLVIDTQDLEGRNTVFVLGK